MSKKHCIYLLRHGEIDLQGQKVLIGQMEVPLSARGKEQALWWRNQWASISFVLWYAVPNRKPVNRRKLIRSFTTSSKVPEITKTVPTLSQKYLEKTEIWISRSPVSRSCLFGFSLRVCLL